MHEDLVILSNKTGQQFARIVSDKINARYVELDLDYFADGEPDIAIKESIRGADVFYFCPFYPDPMKRYAETDIVNATIHYASARRLTNVPTYLGFMRSDWKWKPRVGISIRDVATMMEKYADRVLVMDMHSPYQEPVFRIPIDHLRAMPLFVEYFKSQNIIGEDVVIVAPDVGAAKNAEKLADKLGADMAVIYKKRPKPNKAEAKFLIGNITGKAAILYDDIADTLGTLVAGSKLVKELGAVFVYAACTHGLLTPKDGSSAEEKLEKSPIDELIITDTIPKSEEYIAEHQKIEVLTATDLFAEAIERIHNNKSVSELFE